MSVCPLVYANYCQVHQAVYTQKRCSNQGVGRDQQEEDTYEAAMLHRRGKQLADRDLRVGSSAEELQAIDTSKDAGVMP